MKELTKAEEQIMQVLWLLKKGKVKEVIEKLPEPKPAYNTVSTIIRILEQKSFVGHEPYGKGYIYFPLISQEEYTSKFMKGFVSKYFRGSYKQMLSFFAQKEEISLDDLEQLLDQLKNKPL